MIEKFLKQTNFKDFEDFRTNYELIVPDDFNFAYDVVDGWAATNPDKRALLWTNDNGESRSFTFGELKEISDRTAGFFSSIGIRKGDMVMVILKRRAEFWFTILALHKIGAVIHIIWVYRNVSNQLQGVVRIGGFSAVYGETLIVLPLFFAGRWHQYRRAIAACCCSIPLQTWNLLPDR